MNLDPDDIEAVATRVIELLSGRGESGRYVDAATLARALNVERGWVYARARELGAVRLGNGPKARMRFDLSRARAVLPRSEECEPPSPDKPQRPRRSQAAPSVPLIRGRASR